MPGTHTETLTEFDRRYLETWTDPDPARGRAAIGELWAPGGRMIVSSLGLVVEGVDAIADHVRRVHDENIVGRGLRFSYDQHVDADDAVLLRWSMIAPGDVVVGRGVDLMFRDADGRISTVYMFMGVD